MNGIDKLANYIGKVIAENKALKQQKQVHRGVISGGMVKIGGKKYSFLPAVEMTISDDEPVLCSFVGNSKKVTVIGK